MPESSTHPQTIPSPAGAARPAAPASVAVSVVVPAYNEVNCIAATVKALHEYLSRGNNSYEVVVVDDGSTDATCDVVENLSCVLDGIRLLRQPANRGKGAAVRRGMLESTGEARVFMDADLPYDLSALDAALGLLGRGAADVVLGARDHPESSDEIGYSLSRRLSSWGFSLLVRLLAVKGIGDTQCGFKAFSRESAESIYARTTIDGFGFDPEVLHIAQLMRFRLSRIPVVLRHRKDSRVRVVRDSIRMTRDLLRIRANSLLGRYAQRRREDLPLLDTGGKSTLQP